jgi:putative heme-binding domain-containing protein
MQHEKIPRTDLGAETIRKLQLLGDASIDAAIAQHWGTARATPEEKAQRIAALKELLTSPAGREPDLPRGRAIFAKTCRQCHTLYGDGEKVGPDITGTNRSDLDYILLNVVDPNATVGKDYQAWSVMTDAGKLYVGLVVGEDDRVLSLRTETDTLQIPKEEIEFRELTPVSMMPEGILDQLPEHDIRDLVAYLRSSSQVPQLATRETIGQFFNGVDLALWTAFGGEWWVTDGAMHGRRSDQPGVSARLLSDFLLDDFVLELDVRLTGKQGAARILLAPWLGGSDSKAASLPGEPQIVWLDLRHGPANTDQESPAHEESPDWRAVRIHRKSQDLRIVVDGVQVLSKTIDAATRLRFALWVMENADGNLVVRNVKLSVPADPSDTSDYSERSPTSGDR